MSGQPIRELNDGVVLLKDELSADPLASKRVQIGVITFGPVETVTEFVDAGMWAAPQLTVTSRKVVGLFPEQLRLEFVPVLHRLQGRPAAQG